jgi:hypothetical protein
VLHHGARERLVVDQTDLLQPIQLRPDLFRIEPGPFQPTLQLSPAALAHGEKPKGTLVRVLALARPAAAAFVRHALTP